MNIHYKIVEVWPNDHLIVARYWTDIVSEEFLNSNPNNSYRKDDGTPLRCRSDVALSIPIPAPDEEALKEIILKNAPYEFLKMLENVQNPEIDTSMSEILAIKDKPFVLENAELLLEKINGNTQKELTEEEIEKLIELVTNK